jgi:hypothetical protein
MGMSTHVVGIIAFDKESLKMKAAYDACRAAGVPVPREVERYFGGVCFGEDGSEIDLPAGTVQPWSIDSREGFEVEVAKIPKGVTKIRFYNAW